MALGTSIKTYFDGEWHNGNVPIMRAADHGAWLGSSVFDGARYIDGMAPDLWAHCERVNRSAEALMITPTVSTEDMVALIWDGLRDSPKDAAIYIRPMYWAIDGGYFSIMPNPATTGFAVCLEHIPMPAASDATTLTRTRFCRPTLDSSVVNAKAGCLYPNNNRMLSEARSKGFGNALVADALGNVAETATANVFMVKDGEVFTPIANGTFLSGITRARHLTNMQANGYKTHETVLSFADFEDADEVFLSGNLTKVTPATAFDGTTYQAGPVARAVREMYWDWAAQDAAAR